MEINFGPYLDRTLKVIRQVYNRTFQEYNIDITTEQWMLIDLLGEKDLSSQKEIANKSFKDAPTVSRIIDLLVKKDIVERKTTAKDKRKYAIMLTEKGKVIYNKIKPKVLELRKQGWQNLDEEDYKSFVNIMDKIYENFK